MEKVIRDDKVAVLYSPGYGAGWFTWHNREDLLYHPKLIEMVEHGQQMLITTELCMELLGETDEDCTLYCGGAADLEIVWLPAGAEFQIDEYDGSESIVYKENEKWMTA